MDYLDTLTHLAQIHGEINIRCLFQGQWQIAHHDKTETEGIFHLIEQGECYLTLADETFHLQAGDLFFLPHSHAHQISHQPASEIESQTQKSQQGVFELHQIGASSPDFKMFCGRFFYQKNAWLVASLPDYLHIRLPNTPVQPLIQLFLQEANTQEIGNKSVIDALANVLFIYILRYALEKGWVKKGVLLALQDKRLNNALLSMLRQPEKAWRVEGLAALANMSRANFCRIFQQQLGLPPAKFLAHIRLQQGAYLLKQTQKSVLEVALEIGYQSEAHFSKAFKALFGISPRQYRK